MKRNVGQQNLSILVDFERLVAKKPYDIGLKLSVVIIITYGKVYVYAKFH